MKRLTRETLFKPTRAESKQAVTDNTARSMIEAEAEARQKKTERLRQMRLDAESDGAVEEVKPRRAKR
jgi:hypothetical protein